MSLRSNRSAHESFGNQPQRFYPSAIVKIGRFRSPTLIVDDREVYGTDFDQVEGTMGYFREHLQTRFEFVGEPARKVIWEYPLEALREAITNAVCHREHLDTGHTQVRWYDEHLLFLDDELVRHEGTQIITNSVPPALIRVHRRLYRIEG
jgi:ATP-dependent DNA helicase RecG